MATITKAQRESDEQAVRAVDELSEETSQAENQAVYESSARDYQVWAERVLHAS